MCNLDDHANNSGRYTLDLNDAIVYNGQNLPNSKSIVEARCSDINDVIHEHNLQTCDIPISLIFETVETGDLESFIAFCEKKEREANGQAV